MDTHPFVDDGDGLCVDCGLAWPAAAHAEPPARPIPSRSEARTERDAALAQVERGAGDWTAYAYAFVADYLARHPTLFADDLWAAGLVAPREPRALGPVLNRAVRSGLMRDSGEFRASTRRHLTPGRVWLSLIYDGGIRPVADDVPENGTSTPAQPAPTEPGAST